MSTPAKPTDHDRRMADTYSAMYQDRYALRPKEMQATESLLAKNLGELGFPIDRLPQSVALNVGTGIETVALINLGARKVYHFDVAPLGVDNLNRLKASDSRYAGVVSQLANLCGEGLPVEEGVDVVYLPGVFHHLYDGAAATRNLLAVLNPGGRIFYRNYRPGTLRYFASDFVRKFIDEGCRPAFRAAFERRFGPVPVEQDRRFDSLALQLYQSMNDDFFVPVLRLYDPDKLDAFYAANGCRALPRPSLPAYDHQPGSIGGTQVSLYYALEGAAPAALRGEFPTHVDQMDAIAYREPYIVRTVELMRRALPRLKGLPAAQRLAVAIEIFYAAEAYRVSQYPHIDADHGQIAAVSTAEGLHAWMANALAPHAST